MRGELKEIMKWLSSIEKRLDAIEYRIDMVQRSVDAVPDMLGITAKELKEMKMRLADIDKKVSRCIKRKRWWEIWKK